jgi:hypothetical protein
MKHINELSQILNKILNWNKARVDCLAQMIFGIVKVKSVNLAQVALGIDSASKKESRYRRMQRLLHSYKFDQSIMLQVIQALFPLPRKVILIVDRTNWKFGKAHINLLVMSIAYRGIALPIFWINLARAGNSFTAERIAVMKKIITMVGKKRIKYLLADREFVGKEWFDWLIETELRFLIRERKNTLVKAPGQKQLVPMESLFRKLKPCQIKKIHQPVKIGKQFLYVAASRSPDGELLIVASAKKIRHPITLYRKRWEIETLFGCLKTRGFCFEETKITCPERIERLFFILSIAFCWSYAVGIAKAKYEPIRKIGKKFEYSLFRYGYDLLREVLLNLASRIKDFKSLLKLLSFNKTRRPGYA